MIQSANDTHFIKNICFTVQACAFRDEHTQYPQKIDVGGEILESIFFGP